jgi:hypothetical protein
VKVLARPTEHDPPLLCSLHANLACRNWRPISTCRLIRWRRHLLRAGQTGQSCCQNCTKLHFRPMVRSRSQSLYSCGSQSNFPLGTSGDPNGFEPNIQPVCDCAKRIQSAKNKHIKAFKGDVSDLRFRADLRRRRVRKCPKFIRAVEGDPGGLSKNCWSCLNGGVIFYLLRR